jgi:uncharacterized protein YaaR (DUF327 family)
MQIKEINGYKGYFISDSGSVFSNKSGEMKELATYRSNSGNGYKMTDLFQDGKKHKKLIHRLVAEHFIPNPDHKPEVNHKDTDIINNYDWNLEWVTHKENIAQSYNTMSQIRNFRECFLYKDGVMINEFISVTAASNYAHKTYGISFEMIYKHRKYKGFEIVKKM